MPARPFCPGIWPQRHTGLAEKTASLSGPCVIVTEKPAQPLHTRYHPIKTNNSQRLKVDNPDKLLSTVQQVIKDGANVAGNKRPIIIVIDDNSAVGSIFELGSESLDIELKSYRSAAAAMEYLQDHKPDLLFLDIIMPEKDGLTFLEELRKQPLHKDTKVVMITSKDYDQDKITAKELGAMDFIIKPIHSQEIHDLIAEHTGARLKPNEGT